MPRHMVCHLLRDDDIHFDLNKYASRSDDPLFFPELPEARVGDGHLIRFYLRHRLFHEPDAFGVEPKALMALVQRHRA